MCECVYPVAFAAGSPFRAPVSIQRHAGQGRCRPRNRRVLPRCRRRILAHANIVADGEPDAGGGIVTSGLEPGRPGRDAAPDAALTTRDIDRELVALALPALGALALDPILCLIDTAFIGRLGDAAPLAGVSIASVVLTLSFSIFNFLAMATTPLVARAIGSGDDPSGASRTIAVGLFLSVAIGCVSGSLMCIFAPTIVTALGAKGVVVGHAVAYLRARACVSPVVLSLFVINGTYRGLKDTRTPFYVALAANAINLVLDPLFIFTLGLGVSGAALATSVSQVVAVILMVTSLLRTGRLRVSDMQRLPLLCELLPLLRAGAALTVRTLSILGTVAYATATASTMGVASLASFEITRQLWTLHAMALDSIAAAGQALVSGLLARGSYIRARLVSNRALQLGAICGAGVGLSAILAGPALPSLFTRSEEAAGLAVWCIRVAAIVTPLNGAVFALDGVLAAANDFSYMAFAIAMAGVAAFAALTAVRMVGGNVVAVWGALNVLMASRAVVLMLRYFSKSSPIPRLGLEPSTVKTE